ncbi:hypothetical protein BDW59DRAFT_111139 [Aspergillus cavernicola]|uniref:Uncharacterized protein n=1 Tax=Aspergillus cavernicola TaxID=176166 RepID=A0ABR4I0I5_9EURO
MSFTTTVHWARFKPAPSECHECTFCKTGNDCPTATHPYNTEGHTGLRCYKCSSCSHSESAEPSSSESSPRPYKAQAACVYTVNHTWYVHVPIEEECNSEIFKYRLALAEIDNSKATIYNGNDPEMDESIPDSGVRIPVGMRESAGIGAVLAEARELLRTKLRSLEGIYEFEMHLQLQN